MITKIVGDTSSTDLAPSPVTKPIPPLSTPPWTDDNASAPTRAGALLELQIGREWDRGRRN